MDQANLTVVDLSDKLNLSRQAITNWRSGTSEPSDLARMQALADALGVSAAWLATGESVGARPSPRARGMVSEPPVPYNKLNPETLAVARAFEQAKRTLAEMRDAAEAQELVVNRLQQQLMSRIITESFEQVASDDAGLASDSQADQSAEPSAAPHLPSANRPDLRAAAEKTVLDYGATPKRAAGKRRPASGQG